MQQCCKYIPFFFLCNQVALYLSNENSTRYFSIIIRFANKFHSLIRFLLIINFIFCCELCYSQISGFVFDENKSPLIGVSILLLPDSIQSLSNTNGYFTIQSSTEIESKLIFSYIGYTSDTFVVAPNS